MLDNVIAERYKELACTSIIKGINDWLGDEDGTEYGLYKWLEECTWFDYLDIDRERVYVHVLKLRRKGVKSIKGLRRYGKENYL